MTEPRASAHARGDVTRGPAGSIPASGAAVVAALVVTWLALARAALKADESSVALFGRPLALGCVVRQRFGVPCPGCGATRGFALALNGELARAFHLYPAAPVLVVGLVLLASGLALYTLVALAGLAGAARVVASALRRAAPFVATAAVLAWLTGWVIALRAT